MTAPVMDRVDAVRVSLAAEGIVVSCELDDGTVCVHVDSPRPAVGPVESRRRRTSCTSSPGSPTR